MCLSCIYDISDHKDLLVAAYLEGCGKNINWTSLFPRALNDWELNSIVNFLSFFGASTRKEGRMCLSRVCKCFRYLRSKSFSVALISHINAFHLKQIWHVCT